MSFGKRCMTLFLIAGFIVTTGCSPSQGVGSTSESSQGTTSGYQEAEVTLPEGMSLICFGEDESQNIEGYFGNDEGIKGYQYDPAEGWQEKELPWLEEVNQKDAQLVAVKTLPNGEKIVAYYTMDGEENAISIDSQVQTTNYIARVKTDGTLQQITLEDLDQIDLYQLDIDDEGHIFTCNPEYKVAEYDENGKLVRTYDQSSYLFTVEKGTLYTINAQENTLLSYDLSTGEQKDCITLSSAEDSSGSLVSDQAGKVYLVTSEGIKQVAEGSLQEVMGSKHTSLGLNSMTYQSAIVTDQTKLISYMDTDGTNVIKSYTYVDNLPEISAKVDIYTLEENSMLEQAVKAYENTHLDTDIDIEVGVDEENGVTKEDAVTKLNKLILSGDGPDILLMDGLNVDTYAKQGVLEDMSGWFSEEQKNDWYEQVANAFNTEGRLYALPTHYIVPTLWGDQAIISQIHSMDDLVSYVESHPDEELFAQQDYAKLINSLYPICTPTLVEDSGALNEEALAHFLEQIKALNPTSESSEMSIRGGIAYLDGEMMADMIAVAFGEKKAALERIGSMEELLLANKAIEQCGACDFTMIAGAQGQSFEPTGIVAVNSGSKQKELCKKIINEMLSESMLSQSVGIGFPISKSASKKMIVVKENSGACYCVGDDQGRLLEYGPEESEYITRFIGLGDQVTEAGVVDQNLVEMIIEETGDYFKGTISSSEAAQKVSAKSKLYLLE